MRNHRRLCKFVALSVWTFVCGLAMANEVGLVTAVTGSVVLRGQNSAAGDLKPFVKLRAGDRLTLREARVQMVFFDGGLQETWQGAGEVEAGATSSRLLQGSLQGESRTLSPILVKQLSRTPDGSGGSKTGMIRLRSLAPSETLENLERNYSELRAAAAADDLSPELYRLTGYLELQEYVRLEAALGALEASRPNDSAVSELVALYRKSLPQRRDNNRY